MFLRTAVIRIGLILGMLFIFFASIPIAFFAYTASMFSGNRRLRYQHGIQSALKFVLPRTTVHINNYEILLNTPTPFILAANHMNYFDWMILYSRLKINISVISDTFLVKFPFSILTNRAGFFAIKQKPSFSQSKAVLRIIDAINNKNSVLIFTNSEMDASKFLEDVRPGTAYLSIKTGAPVIPVHIKELNGGKSFDITFGNPILPETEDIGKTVEYAKRIGRSILSLG
ncbi:MAG: lysophospholipid acyltransferase family protein [Candidatus Margulisiibacteriota bacterium]